MFGRAGGELEDRPDAGLVVLVTPGQQGADLGRDVAVGTGELVQLGFVVDAVHPSYHAGTRRTAAPRARRHIALVRQRRASITSPAKSVTCLPRPIPVVQTGRHDD